MERTRWLAVFGQDDMAGHDQRILLLRAFYIHDSQTRPTLNFIIPNSFVYAVRAIAPETKTNVFLNVNNTCEQFSVLKLSVFLRDIIYDYHHTQISGVALHLKYISEVIYITY